MPEGTPVVNALFRQRSCIENILRYLGGPRPRGCQVPPTPVPLVAPEACRGVPLLDSQGCQHQWLPVPMGAWRPCMGCPNPVGPGAQRWWVVVLSARGTSRSQFPSPVGPRAQHQWLPVPDANASWCVDAQRRWSQCPGCSVLVGPGDAQHQPVPVRMDPRFPVPGVPNGNGSQCPGCPMPGGVLHQRLPVPNAHGSQHQ